MQQRVYGFLAVSLLIIMATGLYLIRSNRRVFAQVAALADDRRDLARQLITARESTLREIARELHDEFGQLLTAMGSMLTRAGRHLADGSALKGELREINEIAQSALDHVRALSQTLHPSILEELGLESAIESYLAGVERQLGVTVTYTRTGTLPAIDPAVSIQVYRVLQEALTNVSRHAGTGAATVELNSSGDWVELIVEDRGRGIASTDDRMGATGPLRGARPVQEDRTTSPLPRSGPTTGITGMRERAALVDGTLDIETPPGGGTRVRLRVPITNHQSQITNHKSQIANHKSQLTND